MLTAYDYPTAKLVDEAGIPLILVGDSLGRVMLGYENEIPVSMADMLHHTAAVTRGARRAFVVGDMPFLSYATPDEAVANAGRFLPRPARRPSRSRAACAARGSIEAIVERGHPGDGPHRLDAAGRERRRARSGCWARRATRPGRCWPTRSPSRRPARSRSCSSSCRSSCRARSPSGCTSRRSASAPAPAAAARSRSSRTCSGMGIVAPEARARLRRPARHDPRRPRRYAEDVAAGTFPAAAETVRMDDEVLDDVLGRSAMDRAPASRRPGDPARPRL